MEARGKSKREENEEKEAKRRRRSVDSEDDKPRRRQKSDSRRSDCQILCTINVSVMFVLSWKICTFIFRERVSY